MNSGFHGQSPCDADALTLTARELVGITLDISRIEADKPEQVLDPIPLRRRLRPR
jgi:hypothetical protein